MGKKFLLVKAYAIYHAGHYIEFPVNWNDMSDVDRTTYIKTSASEGLTYYTRLEDAHPLSSPGYPDGFGRWAIADENDVETTLAEAVGKSDIELAFRKSLFKSHCIRNSNGVCDSNCYFDTQSSDPYCLCDPRY